MTLLSQIADLFIRQGVKAAVERTLMPALTQRAYPGHFTVTADGSHFGAETTWPGLDSWEMAGAYLLLGYQREVLGYFQFVRAAQRADGNIPIAILPADERPDGMDTYLRGLRYPEDVFSIGGRRWIGLFHHWQTRVNPLSVLGPISFILTAEEIQQSDPPQEWLAENLESIEAAGRYVLSRKSDNGLIAGAGFYIECPPRDQADGVTQCYAVAAFRALARMCAAAGDEQRAARWRGHADELRHNFAHFFWKGDHFAEYLNPERGVIDLRPLTDVDFAAIALDVASDEQAMGLWPRLTAEKGFWIGGMPTQLVAQPSRYEEWELPEALGFEHVPGPIYDVAAMGRVWYLDALAAVRMRDSARVRESVRLVCQMGERHDWQWHERYHARPDGSVAPAGPKGYCEYAAVLVRIVLGNPELFDQVRFGDAVDPEGAVGPTDVPIMRRFGFGGDTDFKSL